MLSTFVLRLVTDRLARGELVGQVEHIGTGRVTTLRNAGELEAFARSALTEANSDRIDADGHQTAPTG